MVQTHPPRLRVNEGNGRHETWLELFYDLVFVVAIGVVSRRIGHVTEVGGYVAMLFLFLTVWWGWVGHTIYSNRFDTDDLPHRLLTLLQMLGALGMAVSLETVYGPGDRAFILSYVLVRFTLLVLYHRARRHVPSARAATTFYLSTFGLGAGFWLLSAFVDPPVRYLFWVLGSGIDFIAPWIGIRLLSRMPVDGRHLPRRFGLFTIILLGEQIFAVIGALTGTEWTAAIGANAVLAFLIAIGSWWLYFHYQEEWRESHCLRGGQPYIYAHLPLAVGLLLAGIALEHIIPLGMDTLEQRDRLLLSGGISLWLLSIILIDLATRHQRDTVFPWVPFAGAAALGAWCWLPLPGLFFLLGIAILLIILVYIEEVLAHSHGRSIVHQ